VIRDSKILLSKKCYGTTFLNQFVVSKQKIGDLEHIFKGIEVKKALLYLKNKNSPLK